jgi:hypothetical protein
MIREPGRCLAILMFIPTLMLAAGCEIAEPKLPTFTTQVSVPLGEERLDVADALDGEEYLTELGGDILGFTVDGDPDTVSLDFDLAADIAAQSIDQSLGSFTIDLDAPVGIDFTLSQLYPPAAMFHGLTVPVPPFPLVQTSGAEDIEDVESATLSAGTLVVSVHNGLPVPIGANNGANQLVLELVDPATDDAFATVTFDLIPPFGDASRTADLAGVTLPGAASVRLVGGSPGSGGVPVLVNAGASIVVSASFLDLTVTEAVAVVPAQSFTSTFSTELPDDYGVLEAVIADGGTVVTAVNEMSIPCHAVITWLEVVDLDSQPLTVTFDLAPHAQVSREVAFAGHVVRAEDDTPLTALTAQVLVTSPGSNGQAVDLDAAAGVRADVGAGNIRFSSVTGTVPAMEYAFDPLDEAIDLPEELSGLELTGATLTLELENTAGVAADAHFDLTGTSAGGTTRTLQVDDQIEPAEAGRAAVTVVTLDQSNSGIVDFLNNLPTRITLAGGVTTTAGAIGTVRSGDRAVVRWRIVAPVEVIVHDSTIYGDPESLDLDTDTRDLLRDHAGAALADLEVLNHLPLGVELRLLFSADSTSIATDPLLAIGPIAIAAAQRDPLTHAVSAPTVSHPQVALTAAEAALLGTEGLFTLVEVHLPDSAGEAARVLTTDYLTVRGVVRLDVEVSDD